MTDQMMTAAECAAYLHLASARTLKAFVEEAGLPAVRLKGGEVVFQRHAIGRWLGRKL